MELAKEKVVPGIEPGLPEHPEEIRIRSDNRYTIEPCVQFSRQRSGKFDYNKQLPKPYDHVITPVRPNRVLRQRKNN